MEAPVVEPLANAQEALWDLNSGNKITRIAELIDRLSARAAPASSTATFPPSTTGRLLQLATGVAAGAAGLVASGGIAVGSGGAAIPVAAALATASAGLAVVGNKIAVSAISNLNNDQGK